MRELGSGLDWHLTRTEELSTSLTKSETPCDYRIKTSERDVREIAGEIHGLIDWREK